MANTITRTLLNSSDSTTKRYLVLFTVVGANATGDESRTLVNATAGDLGTDPRLLKIHHALSNGPVVTLAWKATTDEFIMDVPTGFPVSVDYSDIGGITNNAGAGKTGDFIITTSGLTNGKSFSLLAEFVRGG